MAKISAYTDATAVTDTDSLLIVDDTAGTPTTKRVDAADAKTYFGTPPYARWVDGARTNSSGRNQLFTGPMNLALTTQTVEDGATNLSYSYVREIDVFTTIQIHCAVAGTGSSECYIVVYNVDTQGFPTTKEAQWGPFSLLTPGFVELTSQTETCPAGFYLVGWQGTNIAGSPTISGFTPSIPFAAFRGGNTQGFQSIRGSGTTSATTDLSSWVERGNPPDVALGAIPLFGGLSA